MAVAITESVEHSTMVEHAERIISGISVDPLVVANKLLEARLVPPKLISTMLLSSKDGYDKATELVMQVMKAVESTPEKFDVFLSILSNFLWLDDLVESVHTQYETNKQNAPQEKKEVSYVGWWEPETISYPTPIGEGRNRDATNWKRTTNIILRRQ